jgi:hypothetical protein
MCAVVDPLCSYKDVMLEQISSLPDHNRPWFRSWMDTKGWPKVWASCDTMWATLNGTTAFSPWAQHDIDLLVNLRTGFRFTFTEIAECIFVGTREDECECMYLHVTASSGDHAKVEISGVSSGFKRKANIWSNEDMITVGREVAKKTKWADIANLVSREGATAASVQSKYQRHRREIIDLTEKDDNAGVQSPYR